ncbi:hypothetical protein NDU88_001990 [Pleurodeles waltl]|uniref:Uncharacterized protein n=1 Tax=Pleurodeles waltl TaxID=8319 RepID=A0AAV7LN40_PLEWA|nr:hypothetical protein NDU88_001990 [Pleurodeles waltl]
MRETTGVRGGVYTPRSPEGRDCWSGLAVTQVGEASGNGTSSGAKVRSSQTTPRSQTGTWPLKQACYACMKGVGGTEFPCPLLGIQGR